MIFVPQRASSLNEIARDLPAGLYHAPRIEIPETLWEGLDRNNGRNAIETVREWGSALHINEIVLGSPVILYDGPGDFQLMQRADLFEIHGFDEEMLLGWHVDSNIAKRLTLLRGKVGDLGKEIYGYHCDHTRQMTPAHSHSRTENDWRRFVNNVERPDIPEQAKTWGCADDEIEEIRLTGQSASAYVRALKGQIGERQSTPPVIAYVGENYNKTDYDPRHVLPYLADMFVSCERRTNLAWFGTRPDMLARFSGFWRDAGFTGDILVDGSLVSKHGLANSPRALPVDFDTIISNADVFVFEFGPIANKGDAIAGLPREMAQLMNRALLQTVRAEHRRSHHGKSSRQVIAINAINNIFESTITTHMSIALTPFSTRMRHGFVLPPMKGEVDWTARLQVGHAGMREGSAIRSREDNLGLVMYGPNTHLHPGAYRLKSKLSGTCSAVNSPNAEVAVLEIISQRDHLGYRLITLSDLVKGEVEIDIDVTADELISLGFSIQTLLRKLAPVDMTISGLSCERVSNLKSTDPIESRALAVKEWLPLLWTGPDGVRRNGHIFHNSAKPGIVFYGPYWRLPLGTYEAIFVLEPEVENSLPPSAAQPYWDATRTYFGFRLGRFREEPIGQLRGLGRLLRAQSKHMLTDLNQARLPRPRARVCTFQAMSRETELASEGVCVGDASLERQVSLAFTVTPSLLADPDFGLDFRLLAHRKLPFAVKSLTVRRVRAQGLEGRKSSEPS